MATEDGKKYDIVVFGATGFTGQFVVEEIARTEDEEGGLTWAVAGRSASKLQNVLIQASKSTGKSLEKTPIIIADVSSEESIQEMCKQARIVLNLVGPYLFYGEQVVKACIQNKAHHVDISGESVYLEGMLLKYDKASKEAGVYIVEACGFDSTIQEMGIIYTRDQFKGDLNHVEMFLRIHTGPDGLRLNFGTLQSGIHGNNVRQKLELKSIQKKMGLQPMPKIGHSIPGRWPLFYSQYDGGRCVPMDEGPDPLMIARTQRYNYEQRNERPIEHRGFMVIPSFLVLLALMIVGIIVAFLSNFSWGRKLLERFPRLMTLGIFSRTGPTRKQMADTSFSMRIEGQGHQNKLDINERHTEKPNQTIVTRITGPELAYVTTPICMVQAAYVMLKEKDNLPKGGGVFSPGAVFAKTTLIERLNNHGIKFEVVKH